MLLVEPFLLLDDPVLTVNAATSLRAVHTRADTDTHSEENELELEPGLEEEDEEEGCYSHIAEHCSPSSS